MRHTAQQTPEERGMYLERRRKRDRAKKQKRREKESALKAMPNRPAGVSKTDPTYRRRLPPLPEMSKREQIAFLAQAVLNTARARP